MSVPNDTPPNIVFIIPYRDREKDKALFLDAMSAIVPKIPVLCEIYFVHQCDDRAFNRGAMRNIGFLAIKNKYPEHYHDMTFVFNDVDTYPALGYIPNYITTSGTVKHFYGFTYTLGGIFSITGSDFEKTRGYPNFWGWGYEDNELNNRCARCNIAIDRSDFVNVLKPNTDDSAKIVNIKGTSFRDVNYNVYLRFRNKTQEGLADVRDLKYEIEFDDKRPTNQGGIIFDNYSTINVTEFNVATPPHKNVSVDLSRGNPFHLKKPLMKMNFT